ncbi:MAG: CSLREA domain-containing protein, partial [Actinomycetota bacterium]|nr:CSLREA domain-containing protein [Actinomycetota bacterium]
MSRFPRLGALVLLAALVPAPASASTFAVTSTEDAPDADPGDGACASAAGVCTLRAAVVEANAGPDAQAIELPSGTYPLRLSGAENAAATGDLDVRADLSIIGAGAGETVVQGGWSGEPDRIFDVRATGTSLLLSDLTVTGGQVTSAQGSLRRGGGIGAEPGTDLSLQRVTVASNSVAGTGGSGGGLFVGGSASIEGSTFTANEAQGVGGALRVNGTATLRNVTVNGNAATDDGGGLSVSGSVTLNNVTIAANVADSHVSVSGDGGGLQVAPTATATISNSIVGDNRDRSTSGDQHPDCSGSIASGGHNVIEAVEGCSGFQD